MTHPSVRQVEVGENESGQRLDNFLATKLKGVPRTRLYRIIRRGEVRINGSRVKPATRLKSGDMVRIPPVRMAEEKTPGRIPDALRDISSLVLFEDADLLVLNKPAGVAVHGGSGTPVGVIEAVKRSEYAGEFIELAHRLDRDTSGCLLLARNRVTLGVLHDMFRRESAGVTKHYIALIYGEWGGKQTRINHPLMRYRDASTGQSRVRVDPAGQPALSIVEPGKQFSGATLVRVRLETGRMHQARVHLASFGFPIAGDPVYGDFRANREFAVFGLNRTFLHASELIFRHPASGRELCIRAPLASELKETLYKLDSRP